MDQKPIPTRFRKGGGGTLVNIKKYFYWSASCFKNVILSVKYDKYMTASLIFDTIRFHLTIPEDGDKVGIQTQRKKKIDLFAKKKYHEVHTTSPISM